jgi:hypothetical protein
MGVSPSKLLRCNRKDRAFTLGHTSWMRAGPIGQATNGCSSRACKSAEQVSQS